MNIYKSSIKESYGLTDSWIARLGPPDKTVTNPHYRSGPSASLYLRARVEALIEDNMDEYQKLQVRRKKAQEKAKEVIKKRELELIKWSENVPIIVDDLPETLEQLCTDAEESAMEHIYDSRKLRKFKMTINVIIAFIRHNLTDYEYLLSWIEGKPGCGAGYSIIKDRVNREVVSCLVQKYGDAQLANLECQTEQE